MSTNVDAGIGALATLAGDIGAGNAKEPDAKKGKVEEEEAGTGTGTANGTGDLDLGDIGEVKEAIADEEDMELGGDTLEAKLADVKKRFVDINRRVVEHTDSIPKTLKPHFSRLGDEVIELADCVGSLCSVLDDQQDLIKALSAQVDTLTKARQPAPALVATAPGNKPQQRVLPAPAARPAHGKLSKARELPPLIQGMVDASVAAKKTAAASVSVVAFNATDVLSTYYQTPIKVGSLTFLSVELAFLYIKCKMHNNEEAALRVKVATRPAEARGAMMAITGQESEEFTAQVGDLWKTLMWLKYRQCPQFAEKLRDEGASKIIGMVGPDMEWNIGAIGGNEARGCWPQFWPGENKLGLMLNEMAAEIAGGGDPEAIELPLPDIAKWCTVDGVDASRPMLVLGDDRLSKFKSFGSTELLVKPGLLVKAVDHSISAIKVLEQLNLATYESVLFFVPAKSVSVGPAELEKEVQELVDLLISKADSAKKIVVANMLPVFGGNRQGVQFANYALQKTIEGNEKLTFLNAYEALDNRDNFESGPDGGALTALGCQELYKAIVKVMPYVILLNPRAPRGAPSGEKGGKGSTPNQSHGDSKKSQPNRKRMRTYTGGGNTRYDGRKSFGAGGGVSASPFVSSTTPGAGYGGWATYTQYVTPSNQQGGPSVFTQYPARGAQNTGQQLYRPNTGGYDYPAKPW